MAMGMWHSPITQAMHRAMQHGHNAVVGTELCLLEEWYSC
jgi:hypothetical protein